MIPFEKAKEFLQKHLSTCLLAAGGILLFFFLLPLLRSEAQKQRPESPGRSAPAAATVGESSRAEPRTAPAGSPVRFPTDTFFITRGRSEYEAGSLRLIVPKIGVDSAVMDGTENWTLNYGPGLHQYAQLPNEALLLKEPLPDAPDILSADSDWKKWIDLYTLEERPGEGNPNVSIAGHRDVKGCEFYSVDKLESGDLFYLVYQDTVYCYRYEDTRVVGAEDTTPMYCRDFSALTLISCDPIGSTRNRIIVTARFQSAAPYTIGYSLKEKELPPG